MSSWLVLSILAMCANVAKTLSLRHLCSSVDSRFLVFCSRILTAIVLIPYLLITGLAVPASPLFWIVTASTASLTALASILLTDAVRLGKLSAVLPMQAAVPVVMLVVLLGAGGEAPRLQNTVFIILTAGALALTLYEDAGENRTAASSKLLVYTLFSLAAAILTGVSTVLDRVAVKAVTAGALVYSGWWNLASAAILAVECARAGSFAVKKPKNSLPGIAIFSILSLLAFVAQQLAVQKSLSIPAGVVNVKTIIMLYLPLVIVANTFCFGEKSSKKVIFAGIIAIACGIALVQSQR